MKPPIAALLLLAACRDPAPAPVASAPPAPAPLTLAAADVAWTTPWTGDRVVTIAPGEAAHAGPHELAGEASRAPGRRGILVVAAAAASAARVLEVLDQLTGDSRDLWLGVDGAGVPALALRFGGAATTAPSRPVIDLRASGVSVRRPDDAAHGEIPWHGDPVDAVTVAAAHQHVARETGTGDAVRITVDDTITMQQLVAILGVVRADGATRIELATW